MVKKLLLTVLSILLASVILYSMYIQNNLHQIPTPRLNQAYSKHTSILTKPNSNISNSTTNTTSNNTANQSINSTVNQQTSNNAKQGPYVKYLAFRSGSEEGSIHDNSSRNLDIFANKSTFSHIALNLSSSNPITFNITIQNGTKEPQGLKKLNNTYQYVVINTISSGSPVDSQLSTVAYNFSVPISWVESEGISSGNIKLMKYDYSSGQWHDLPTVFTGSNATSYFYTAQSSSMSTYAVSYATQNTTSTSSSISLTMPSGYSYYFVGVGETSAAEGTSSGTADTNVNYKYTNKGGGAYYVVNIAHQTQNTGSLSFSSSGSSALAGIGANVLYSNGAVYQINTTSGTSLTLPYTVKTTGSYVILIFASGGSSFSSAPTLPSGCTEQTDALSSSSAEAEIAVCPSESSGSQSVTVDTSATSGIGAVAYVFPPYTVTLDDSPTTGTITTDGSTYSNGATISVIGHNTITANPPSGTSFSGWSVSNSNLTLGSATANPTTLVVEGNGILTATYQAPVNTIFTESGLPSSTTWNVIYGGTLGSSSTNTITITHISGSYSYTIASQTVSGTTYVASPGSGTVVTGNTTSVKFYTALSTPTISSSSSSINSGQSVTFSSTWSGGLAPYGASLYASSTSSCNRGSTLIQQSIGLSSNSITFTPVYPSASTYYCVFVTDNSSNPSPTSVITSGISNPYGVSFAPSGTYAYVGQSSNVLVVSTATNTVTGSIAAGFNSVYDIAFAPSGTYAYAVNYNSNNISIINTATNSVTGYITSGFSAPEGVSFAPSGTYAYVANYGSSNIVIINTATNSVGASITTGISDPEGVAFSPSGKYAYATYHGGTDNAIVINTATNSVVGYVNGKFTVPSAVAFAPSGMFSYVINQGLFGIPSNVSVIDAVTNTVVSSFESSGTPNQFNKVAFSPDGSYAYLTSSASSNVLIISTGSTSTNSIDNKITVFSASISPSFQTINATHTATITGSISGGLSPYTYQWYAEAPGQNTYTSSEANALCASPQSTSCLFTPTYASMLGNYSFELNVKDSGSNSIISNSANIFVYSILNYTSPTISNSIIDMGQISTINTTLWGGSGGTYSGQWTILSNNQTSPAGNITKVIPVQTSPYSIGSNSKGTIIYVPNQGSGTVSVVNTATNTVINTITVSTNPQSVAFTHDGSIAYVCDEGITTNNVDIINVATNTVVGTITAGSYPSALALSPKSSLLYVSNYGSGTVSVINTATNSVVNTITVGTEPYGVAINPSGTLAYIANEYSGTLSVINTTTNTVTSTLTMGSKPVGISFNPSGTLAYVNDYGDLYYRLINVSSTSILKTPYAGGGQLSSLFAPSGRLAYLSVTGNNTLDVVSGLPETAVQSLPTPSPFHGALKLTIDPVTSNTISITFNGIKYNESTGTNKIYGSWNIAGFAQDNGTNIYYYGSNTLLFSKSLIINPALSVMNLTPSNATLVYGNTITFSLIISGGTGPFTANLVYASNGLVIQSKSGVSDGSVIFNAITPSVGSNSYKAIVTDTGTTTAYTLNSSISSVTVLHPSTFIETGLPSNSMWNVSYGGITGFQSIGSWDQSPPYPITDEFPGCAAGAGYIYCVGGDENTTTPVNTVYFANITPSKSLSTWNTTSSYPLSAVGGANCVVYSLYIYCIGGLSGTAAVPTNAVYYAPISSSGISSWTKTTSYPTPIFLDSCSQYNNYVYCVGGNTTTASGYDTNSVYYAQLSSSGIGAWTSTTPYPTNIEVTSCSTYNGYIYCVGGFNGLPNSKRISNVYYATASSSGVGTWQSTTNYPLDIDQHRCSAYNGYLYCLGGSIGLKYPINSTYMTNINSSGIGAWIKTTPYPTSIENNGGCISFGSYLYCITGRSESGPSAAVYFATLTPPNTLIINPQPGNVSYTVSNQVVSSTYYSPTPYSGSSSGGNVINITFSPAPTLSVQYSPELYGQNDIITANTLSADGIQLLIDGVTISTSTGSVTYNANTLSVGSHTIQAKDTNSGKYSLIFTLNVSRSVSSIYCTAGENSSLSIVNRTYSGILSNFGVNNFTVATNYPLSSEYHTCVSSSGYIYCLGGKDAAGSFLNATYSAPLYYNGTGHWKTSTPYPINVVVKGDCASYNNYIYCSGGKDAAGVYLSSSYFASLSLGNVSSWSPTTAYPTNTDFNNCVASGGYMYCTRGEGTGNIYLSGSYYAPISSSGIGSWASTNAYPTNSAFGSCVSSNSYIYCLGGSTGVVTNSSYYAQLSSSGIETWHQTTAYPSNVEFTSCVSSNSYIFCTGGSSPGGVFLNTTYYAQLSSSGIGAWKNTARYPTPTELEECVAQQFESSSFVENGLPSSSLWNVTYDGITSQSSSNTISIATIPGNYLFTVSNQLISSSRYVPSPSSGSVIAGNSTSIIFNIFSALKSLLFLVSNSLIDQNQYQTLNSVVSGGVTPYTYNFLVYNAMGSLVTNELYSTSSTSNTFTYSQNPLWGTGKFTANVIITDSESPRSTVSNSIDYGSNTFLVAPTPASSPNTIQQGSNSILTENDPLTGTSPYTYQWLEESPGTTSYSTISGATSNTYTFATSGSTTTGLYNFSMEITDSATTKVTSVSSPTSVDVTAATCTIALNPVSIDFGQVLPSFNYSTSKYISDTNGGGIEAYIYAYGGNWINATNTLNNFYVSNTMWNPSSLNIFSGNRLTQSASNTLIGIQGGKTANIFIGAAVPFGQQAAMYSQTLTITNVC